MKGEKTMYQGVVFDLDGTLLNTLYDLSDSVNQALETYGYSGHSSEEYKKMIGGGFYNLIERSLPKEARSGEIIEKVLEEFLSVYDRNYINRTAPYDGIEELVRQLAEKGIRLGVNSNKRTDYTQALVRKFFPETAFVAVIGNCREYPKKPDPAAALEIASRMGLAPAEIVYIGDSKTDMLTGENAGMDTIGVTWGFRDEEELRKYNATKVVRNPGEILEYICR